MTTAHSARSMRRRGSRSERALPQLGDTQLDVPGLGGQKPRARAVSVGNAPRVPAVALGADRLGGLELDERLEHELHP
jgi:hypothetical protein